MGKKGLHTMQNQLMELTVTIQYMAEATLIILESYFEKLLENMEKSSIHEAEHDGGMKSPYLKAVYFYLWIIGTGDK